MRPNNNNMDLLLLPLALCGFALAQPVYNLLLQTPVFLVARQNIPLDVWVLTIGLSFILPILVALPGWWLRHRWPIFSLFWCWLISTVFASLFSAQILQGSLGSHWVLFIGAAISIGASFSWILLKTRWSMLTGVLALVAGLFPLWFLLFSPVLKQVDEFAAVTPVQKGQESELADIVFVILDELPMATLLDNSGQVDKNLFPGFARLQSMSDWYANTTSVSDGTGSAVPAILTGRYPGTESPGLTVAKQPVNLFTILRQHYQYNVAEAVTRFCPDSLCPRAGPSHFKRLEALFLDLSAIYLHRVVPDQWVSALPAVTNNWSGFFAEQQVFFPQGWLKHAGAQTEIDRPGYFRTFNNSIRDHEGPVLNFMHILFPHEPNAYLPDGDNYGLAWMRGQFKEVWGDVEWGVISGKQRHYLQVQYADFLLLDLLDTLEERQLLNDSMIVVVADHGISFELGDTRRALSDINKASLLRVPLFIKRPGQTSGEKHEIPAMTIDIIPTILAELGLSAELIVMDGQDLRSPGAQMTRTRRANSHRQRELQDLDEADLEITELVARDRRQLGLDNPSGALWEIGPFDQYRGQPLETVCNKSPADFSIGYDKFKPLPNSDPASALPAYVVGTFNGGSAHNHLTPFLITSNDLLVASGHTWSWNETPIFFALVEPEYVRQKDWQPVAWMLEDGTCFGAAQ